MRCSVFIVLGLAGCAWQSEPLQVDTDTYRVSVTAAPARGGITGAQEMALRNANKKCSELGKAIHVTDITTGHDFPAAGVATVTFECK